jgi:hypothetical protein
MIGSSRARDVRCGGALVWAASAALPLPWHFRLWGNVSTPWNPSVLPPSESGRFELDWFLGASSAGRPTRPDQAGGGPVSGVPGLYGGIGAWVRPNGASLVRGWAKAVEVDLVVDAPVGWARVGGGVVAHAAFDGARAGPAGSVGVEPVDQVAGEVIK